MADKFIIRITAGSTYDLDQHTEVPVNTADPVKVSSDLMDIELNVRVQNYKGLPRNSPATSPYFSTAPHDHNKDQWSICFRFTPKKPSSKPTTTSSSSSSSSDKDASKLADLEEDGTEDDAAIDADILGGIAGPDLQFGNDFDHPIRDRLPPGFGTAMNIVKWWIDPGLEGDAYADEPYLYGPALSSFNTVRVGDADYDPERGGLWVEEGGDEAGREWRKKVGAPEDAKRRMKWALGAANKEKWTWEWGRTYAVDFFNPYVDFTEFALNLPGFKLGIIRYWDGQPLRYVLRNRATGDTYLVVLFTLYLKEDVNEDGSLKPAAVAATKKGAHGVVDEEVLKSTASSGEADGDGFDAEKATEEARRKFEGTDLNEKEGPDEANEEDEGVD